MEKPGSRWSSPVRGMAVIGAVLIAAGAMSPALSAFNPTKGKIKKIARKQANKVRKQLQAQIDAIPLEVLGNSFVRATATAGPDEATARTNAPKIPLTTVGPLSIYGKCFSYPTDSLAGEIFIETSVPGVILSSRDLDDFDGDPDFLDPDTPEVDRQIFDETAGANTATYEVEDTEDNHAMAPGGTALDGAVGIAVKNGDLAGGNGVYGDGDVCLFSGYFVGS